MRVGSLVESEEVSRKSEANERRRPFAAAEFLLVKEIAKTR